MEETEPSRNLRKSSRFRSIFITISNFIIIDGVILCVLFSFFSARAFINNNRERLTHSNESYLNSIVSNTDYLISSLHQSLTQMSYSGNIWRLIFSKSPDSSQISNVKLELIYLTEHTLLIEESFLYIPSSALVIDSEKTQMSELFNDYKNQNLIADYEEGNISCTKIYDNGKVSYLFLDQNQLVIVRDFPLSGSDRLASLYYIIDKNELMGILLSEIPDYSQLAIYNGDSLLLSSSNSAIFSDENYVCMEQTSDLSDWNFIYAVDRSLFQIPISTLLRSILPAILIMLAVSIAVAFLIAYLIYRPIHQLANTVDVSESSRETNPEPKNELEYFSFAYNEAMQKRAEMNQLLATLSHDTMSRIFHNIMAGTIKEEDNIPELLASINSPYLPDNLYQVALIEFSGNETEKINHLDALTALSQSLDEKYASLSHPLMMYGTTYCIVFSFQKDTSLTVIRSHRHDFMRAIDVYAENHSVNATTAFGHLYCSLFDLSYSFQEAQNELELGNKKSAQARPEEPVKPDYTAYAQNIFQTILDHGPSEACSLSDRILKEMNESGTDIKAVADNYIGLISSLLDRIFEMDYTDNLSVAFLDNLKSLREKGSENDRETLLSEAKDICDTLIQETGTIIKKHNNHYIVSAQKYIQKHFSDYDLSLNNVAAAIDINPSYLSRLFKSNLGIHFTEYLNNYRINQSIDMLTTTDQSVREISENTGFNSVQNYIRVFKKYTGLTPKQYRDTYENMEDNKNGKNK